MIRNLPESVFPVRSTDVLLIGVICFRCCVTNYWRERNRDSIVCDWFHWCYRRWCCRFVWFILVKIKYNFVVIKAIFIAQHISFIDNCFGGVVCDWLRCIWLLKLHRIIIWHLLHSVDICRNIIMANNIVHYE